MTAEVRQANSIVGAAGSSPEEKNYPDTRKAAGEVGETGTNQEGMVEAA